MNGMKYLLVIACALTVITAQAKEKEETEKEIALKDAPAEIQEAINTFIGLLPDGSKLDELIEEKEDETIVYKADVEIPNGEEWEVEFSAQGKIVEIEIEGDDTGDDEEDDGEHEDEDEDEHEDAGEDMD